MSASFAAVIGVGTLMALSLFNENKVTGMLQKRVQGENLIHLARETNESALGRMRSLLIADGAQPAALKVLSSKEFQKISGTGFEVDLGLLRMYTPQPPAEAWTAIPAANAPRLATVMRIDDITLDSAGVPAVIVVSASTTTQQAELSKTITSRARFDLNALNLPAAPAPVPVLPGAPAPTPPPTTVASNPPDPCSTTGTNLPTATGNVGIGNTEGGLGIANNNGGIGIANSGSGLGIGNTNGGIGIGNNGGIGIGSECGGIGINAPAGCIGIGLGGKSCLGIRYR